MASRTIQTTDDFESALAFLSKDGNGDAVFQQKLQSMMEATFKESNDKRVAQLRDVVAKSASSEEMIAKLRDLLK